MKWWKVALIASGVILVAVIVWKVPQWQVRAYHGRLDANAISKLTSQELIQLQKDLITAENNARATLAQIIGGLVVLLGLYATFKNVRIAQDNHRVAMENLRITEEGKLTERFSKAVELLGNAKLDVRLGGVYALERIARDSQKDHWTVMEVLTAFVREQTRGKHEELLQSSSESSVMAIQKSWILREDAQASLTIIGRRKWVNQEYSHNIIDLSYSILGRATLLEANLRGAYLFMTYLSMSLLMKVDLSNSDLCRAILAGANLNKTNLSGARLDGANLRGANLSNSIGLTWEQLSEAIIDETTKLPPELEKQRKAEQEKKAPPSSKVLSDGY